METRQLIGARIRELRKNRHFTQEQLAEKMGINPKYLSGIERGKENPTLDTFIKVAETLEVSIGELFYQLEVENPKKRLQAILTLIEQAPTEQQRLAVKVLSALF
ncbi:XRE family transcriptional regulator [Desulfosarcina alkanivorans]|uniref:XRE family transcriptional regulator n=1 Tax=Desulfosarcina alkanivorans TaxID=571177 RepID=A0A5K7YFT8_9BACT|nr:helix-turn-helix transcriptional regulator [Desulfosarcina alkanivorans]BBO67928.1 XRE family transcriptional regulator [Desulfosarcina alkanivorans]